MLTRNILSPKRKVQSRTLVKLHELRGASQDNPGFVWRSYSYSLLFLFWVCLDCPPAPILSPDPPEPLYLVGENITFWCSIPNLPLQGWRGYQFSHIRENEKETSIKDLDWHEGNVSLVLTATREVSGLYKCRYLEWKYERNISSKWSRQVSIVVRDPLPPPVLKLHPSSESLGILTILCLSSESNNTKRFHFSQDGVEMTFSNEEPLRSSRDSGLLTLNMSVAFLYAKDNESLQLACRYEENINGRWIMSPWSQTLNIPVEPVWSKDFAFIWSYARMAIPFIILLVPFAFYCWKKKSNVEITYSCTQDSFTPSSPEPTRKNHLTQEKTGETLYQNLLFQPRKKQQNHPIAAKRVSLGPVPY
ncbi:uncharacterized protein LOC131196926 [Ahaetulla prasina]|uniref:uncharacterized protein LOC131196926 n=1 Tax=Ahaetulla prasina TaxID=499056 RepID=UPI002648766F|nr:uncharacterized protein LOC131196926 [Ahaetulla prasina]